MTKNELSKRTPRGGAGFTLIELLVVIAIIGILAALLLPGLSRAKAQAQGIACMNNTHQLALAFRLYADDNEDRLVACQNAGGRPIWFTGNLNYTPSRVNWDIYSDMVNSPLWPYAGKAPSIFKCPADKAVVLLNGERRPRVRSNSMSQVFGSGEWLNGGPPGSSPSPYLTYDKLTAIRRPVNTFVFVDEHPDSINDAAFANSCRWAQPEDPPGSERIVDIPASYHNGACGFSFSDGHSEIHKWIGSAIRVPPTYTGRLLTPGGLLNYPAGDSGVDVRWLAQNTTVKFN